MELTGHMKAAVILLIIHTTTARTAKSSAPSVHEIVNEQARIDDKRPLPYGNPLAGNSLQNAKLHAQHQQAMFNAERVRQHRAQLQRWNKAPQQVDSYMKAYQESQESHQLALEQMQTTQKDKKPKSRPERPNLKSRAQHDPVKITRADAVEKNRNHRSFGSVYYNVLQKNRNVNTSPGTTYDQGVTIKPNGNIELNALEKGRTNLYTEAIPSKTQYVYPKLYHQMHSYQSADDIHALNTLLAKQPQEQLSELNTLVHTNPGTGKDTLETPIDLFFYLNEPHKANGVYNVENGFSGPYATKYVNYDDHKPITEETVEDIEDYSTPKYTEVKTYLPSSTPTPQIYEDPTTKKSNYYNNAEFSSHSKPSYAAFTYEKPLTYYKEEQGTEGLKYLQSQPSGVQHLTQDGTGVSAYGNDDVSIKKQRTRRQLDTDFFILGNETLNAQKLSFKTEIKANPNNKTLDDLKLGVVLSNYNVTSESSLKVDFNSSLNATDGNESLPKPDEWKRFRNVYNDHATGVAKDYDYYEDDNTNKDYSYDSDYDPDYEFSPPDFDYGAQNNFKRPTPFARPNRPKNANSKQNFVTESSFSNRYIWKHPNFNDFHSNPSDDYGPPNQQYGPPDTGYGPPNTGYGPPNTGYGPPKAQFRTPKQQYGPPSQQPEVSSILDALEPVYMLTETQLKHLVGQHNVNVQHLDVFQYPSITKSRPRYPRKIKKHRQSRGSGGSRKLNKLKKLNKIIY